MSLRESLESGKFTITTEIGPLKGTDITEIEELACLADETVFVPYIMLEQQSEFQSVVEYYRYLVEGTDPSFRFWFACGDDSPDMVAFAREVNGR